MWQLPASFGTPCVLIMIVLLMRPSPQATYLFSISALASTTGYPSKKRHCRDTFRSLTGAYFLGSLNRRSPCFFLLLITFSSIAPLAGSNLNSMSWCLQMNSACRFPHIRGID
ncbi:hypothetical protein EV702DRAFT_1085566 [Suillus placidus]|uniref:Secreted protein n=1 Tax=Suillus placidus TaxID=48579 RepID=A0A9P6ZZD4_9AGAM|nr:hypothetical protein EV702DRAFT_1085566 [Suillus placidus]